MSSVRAMEVRMLMELHMEARMMTQQVQLCMAVRMLRHVEL